jgi:hypothetical protein
MDFYTKPLQGSLFKKFRDQIMNLDVAPTADSLQDHRSVLEKSVAGRKYNPEVNLRGEQNPEVTPAAADEWIVVHKHGRRTHAKKTRFKTDNEG